MMPRHWVAANTEFVLTGVWMNNKSGEEYKCELDKLNNEFQRIDIHEKLDEASWLRKKCNQLIGEKNANIQSLTNNRNIDQMKDAIVSLRMCGKVPDGFRRHCLCGLMRIVFPPLQQTKHVQTCFQVLMF